jgi:CarD family transcriptional regulator
MWSKRAQEYEAKINSGNPSSIAEVIRDLYKDGGDAMQSFSERQIYQHAMERLAREISIVEKIEEDEAVKKLEMILQAA